VEKTFDLSGGALCLDFANTIGEHRLKRNERLTSYSDLLAWSRQAGALSQEDFRALTRWAGRRPREATGVLEKARRLREEMFEIFSAFARRREVRPEDLTALNKILSRSLGRLSLAARKGGFGWRWTGQGDAPEGMLWPVARSAADLLVSEERTRVRECGSATCSWLFLDRSRSRRRRWCDMSTCGNRAKARRHYRRIKAAARRRAAAS
jgi:predicted RNA-binding Zn ribbon-like protein